MLSLWDPTRSQHEVVWLPSKAERSLIVFNSVFLVEDWKNIDFFIWFH